jgi:CHAT domain-containing protein/tetratricopeptide (TPR) repeat protein
MRDRQLQQCGERAQAPKRAGVRGSALFVVALLVALGASSAFAGPKDDAGTQATAIQQSLDDGNPAAAEALARTALAQARAQLGEGAPETANLSRLLGDTLYDQRRYGDAEPFFRKALAIREAVLDPVSEDVAHSATDLALTLKELGRYDEAEPFYRQALRIREALVGPGHMDVAKSLLRLSRLFSRKGDYASAAVHLTRAVAIAGKALGEGDRTTVLWTGELAQDLHDAGDLTAAEPVYRRAIAAAQTSFAKDDADLANFRQGLGNLLRQTARPAEAEPLYRVSLAAWKASLGPSHQKTAMAMENLGATLAALDRPGEAFELYREAMAIRETVDGADAASVARDARHAANLALKLDRNADAEILGKRALAHSQTDAGGNVETEAYDLFALGTLYASQRRSVEAEPLLTRAIALFAKAEGKQAMAIETRSALAMMKHTDGDSEAAAVLYEQSIADLAAVPGIEPSRVASLRLSLARVRLDQGRVEEAEQQLARSEQDDPAGAAKGQRVTIADTMRGDIAMRRGETDEALRFFSAVLERTRSRHGEDSPLLRSALGDVARARFAAGDFGEAVALLERSVAITDRLADIDAAAAATARTGSIEDRAVERAGELEFLVKAYDRLAQQHPGEAAALAEKAFMVAQKVTASQAATALSQMAARQASGSGELAALVRERQDRVAEWQAGDRKLTAARSRGTDLTALQAGLDVTNARIVEIDRRLAADFPDYAAYQRVKIASFAEVRAGLSDDELLLFYAETSRRDGAGFETYLWAVPRTGDPRWVKLSPPTGELSAKVRRLRALLGAGGQARGARTLTVSQKDDRVGEILSVAAELYTDAIGPVSDMAKGKSLVVVPSRKLSGLPFHLLVKTAPAAGPDRFRDAAWLAREHAITVVPSVGSLGAGEKARDGGEKSRSTYLGFADPLLTGSRGEDRRAFSRQSCDSDLDTATFELAAGDPLSTSALMRSGAADVEAVRSLQPLPETTDEVCAVARSLGAGEGALRLGASATEAEVKRLSQTAELSRAAILHFATHGLVSGDLQGLAEPAIVLTPPQAPGPQDDGLLTASEVTTLKLDADWVILSACNTAAGESGGESLSGLARAFFYAGARSLMVSHWPVNSDAAVSLVTGAIDAMATDPGIDRAEALRRAMLAEIDKGGSHADPANWAPFITVGSAD